MTKIFFIISLALYISCNSNHQTHKRIEQAKLGASISNNKKTYEEAKLEVATIKDSLRKEWKNLSVNKRSVQFSNVLINKIIPYWYGTKWNYNGATLKPGQGNIACGYFVTTTLQDVGLNILRNKLAQCASEQMIRQLVNKKYIHQFRNTEMTTFLSEIKNKGFGVFIIGLDNHTGFIYNDGNELYFIHSCYINSIGVIKEKASASGILYYSKYKVTGKISDDETALNNWIKK